MNKNNRLKRIIMETVRQTLMEGGMFKDTATPLIHIPTVGDERGNHNRNLDKHPDETDSQITRDEEGFKTGKDEHFVVSDSRFTFYKVKNFGNPNIKDTLSLFGGGAQGETELKKAIHTVNGAAKRNGKYLRYRTITSESNQAMSERTDHMRGTFWEFSYGGDWFILKPHPVQNLKISTFNPNPKPINEDDKQLFQIKRMVEYRLAKCGFEKWSDRYDDNPFTICVSINDRKDINRIYSIIKGMYNITNPYQLDVKEDSNMFGNDARAIIHLPTQIELFKG